MSKVSPRTMVLLEGPILPTLLRLSLPNFLNLFSIAALITFDGVFVGRLGTDALAGVSLVFPFVVATQHLAASGMGGAVSSAMARALGAGDRDRADALATHAFALAVGLAILTSVVMLSMGPFFYRLMGGHEEMLGAATTYSTVIFSGAICIYLLNILASVVRGTGDMTLPALVLVGGTGGHVLLSPLLGGIVGTLCALLPEVWMRLFTAQAEVIRVGALYPQIVAPVYALFGFGQALYFSSQGFGNPLPPVLANVARLVVSAIGGLVAVLWFGAGPVGLFLGIASGFILYAILNALILMRTTDPGRDES